jgi:amphi-Trp domain-containing protein
MNNTVDETSQTRDVEHPYTAAEFAIALRRLAERIEQGEPIEIEVAGETVVVPEDAAFSVEHERGEDEEEVEFQMKWTRAVAAEEEEDALDES